jgi:ABC-type Mn2+/Zn2+ transport system permease subunit
MHTLREILDPGFLLRNSVYISIVLGLTCPLVGVYLVLRRLVFMGVALPQVSSCGIAFALALQGWGLLPHSHESAGEQNLAFLGSTFFTLATILFLSRQARRRNASIEASVGTAYVLAGAWSLLLLVKNPIGEHGVLDLLKGEIIAISNFQLAMTAGTLLLIAAAIVLFNKEFLLTSFDPEMATSLKKNVPAWDTFLFLLVGLTISLAVLSVGPLVTFGFLLLPPLAAHRLACNMRQFALFAALIGGAGALTGFALAYRFDLPVGATDIALLGIVYLGVLPLQPLLARRQPRGTPQPS